MSGGLIFILGKGFMGFILPIALGLWELHRLRRYRDQDALDGRSAFEREPLPPPPPRPSVATPRARAKVPELV